MQLKIPDSEYRALPYPSFSSLKYLLGSPLKYKFQKLNPFRGNDATELGTAIHMWLQGDRDLIVFEPDLSGIKTKEGKIAKSPRMTNEGKAILELAEQNLPKGSILVPYETQELLLIVQRYFEEDPFLQARMASVTNIELAHYGLIHGLFIKGKFDFEGDHRSQPFVIDIKSTGEGGHPEKFRHVIKSKHYDLQAAIYATLKAQECGCSPFDIVFQFIVVETFPPFEIFKYTMSTETLADGFNKLTKVCDAYTKYIVNGASHYEDFVEI